MALGMNLETATGGSKFVPAIKFDAKAGDLIVVNRDPQSDGTWEKTDIEVPMPVRAVMDFENLQVGWLTFTPSYNSVMAKVGSKMPAQPSPDHKQAVVLRMFFKEHGLRDFTPTSKTVLRVVNRLHDEYLEGVKANAGKLPLVEFAGTETVKIVTPQGELRFKAPTMKIVSWVAPPKEMSEQAAAAPAATPAPAAKKPADDFDEAF